jgi:hypothetical protein
MPIATEPPAVTVREAGDVKVGVSGAVSVSDASATKAC